MKLRELPFSRVVTARRAALAFATYFLVLSAPAQVVVRRADDDPSPAKPAQAALKKRFSEMLSDVVLVGTWQMTRGEGLAGKAKLSPPRTERYSIESVHKADADFWQIRARIEYAAGDGEGVDVTIPLRLRVVWAEDTPIITLDKVGIPGVGVYSARVMIYHNFYAGTWFGEDYGGVLSGQILKRADHERLFPAKDPAPQLGH